MWQLHVCHIAPEQEPVYIQHFIFYTRLLFRNMIQYIQYNYHGAYALNMQRSNSPRNNQRYNYL